MRLLEAIVEANHRAVTAGTKATLNLAEFADALPVVALTCIDPRLNRLIPEVLGVPEEHFIWLRNAGNIITGPLSSTMRSLALACAGQGGEGRGRHRAKQLPSPPFPPPPHRRRHPLTPPPC